MASKWTALKWAAGVLWSVVLVTLRSQLDPQLHQPRPVVIQKLALALAFSLACAVLYLLADRNETLAKLKDIGLCFPTHNLEPKYLLDKDTFREYYQSSAEAGKAEQELSRAGCVLILGRPAGGKSRLAYNLAKKARRHRVLLLPHDFNDWKSLSFPRIPPRSNVIWIVDNLNKFRTLDLLRAERVLKDRCKLKIIVTCRTGEEIDAIDADDASDASDANRTLRNFVGSFPRITVPDLSETELLLLAEKTGKPLDASQYDGTPGSVTLGLSAMKRRLGSATSESQTTMKALFLLQTAFIFDPTEPLLTAVLSKIYRLEPADATLEAAVSMLRKNGFLRDGPSLAPAHDCYLSPEFFQYYPRSGKALDQDLRALGSVVEKHGTLSDCKSLGTYWNAKEDYRQAVKYLQRAASGDTADGILGHQLSLALYHTEKVDKAIAVLKRVVASNPHDLIALCNLALFQQLSDAPQEEILKSIDAVRAGYDVYKRGGFAVVRAGSKLYMWTGPAPRLARSVAGVMVMKGLVLRKLGRHDEAIRALEDVVRRFQDLPPSFDLPIAQAFFYKGTIMASLNRRDEAIRAYDEVLRRFNTATEPLLRLTVAKAGVNKGVHLQHQAKAKEAAAAFNDVLRRFWEDRDPKMREQFLRAMVEKAYSLSELNRHDEAIELCDAVLDLLRSASDIASKICVARALIRKSFALYKLNRTQEAIRPCNEVLRRFSAPTEFELQIYIAEALHQKGAFLLQLNHEGEAKAALSELVERFEHSTEPQLQNSASIGAKGLSLLSKLPGKTQLVSDLLMIGLGLYDGVDQA